MLHGHPKINSFIMPRRKLNTDVHGILSKVTKKSKENCAEGSHAAGV
jgi:hypothetical protein